MKILMVCLGNICRSPLAEGILQSKIGEAHQVDSAGTGNWHIGNLPDKRSIAIAKKYNIDITDQRARQFQLNDFDEFDLIYAMDASNLSDLKALAKNKSDQEKLHLILNETSSTENKNVPDPYYGEADGFETVYQLLDEVTDKIVEKLKLHR